MASGKGNPSGVPVIGFVLNALSAAVWPIWALTVAGWVAQVVALAFVEPGNSNSHYLQVGGRLLPMF